MKPTVLVTGATGFLASHIIKLLLEQGKYNVRATVRSVAAKQKYQYLIDLAQGKQSSLEFVEADLSNAEQWPAAVQGTVAVLHVASPVIYQAKDPQKEIVDPAVNGTLYVLKAAAASGTVKRVVITSSGGAIATPYNVKKGHVYTEEDWNEDATLEGSPYFYSKVLAEKAAWKFAQEHKGVLDVTVLLPVYILGPAVNHVSKEEFSVSLKGLQSHAEKLQKEKTVAAVASPIIIHVNDVARAHVLALDSEKAAGKRIMVASGSGTWYDHFVQVAKKIHAPGSEYEHLKKVIPEPSEITAQGNIEQAREGILHFSNKALHDYIPEIGTLVTKEDAIIDCLEYLVERKML